MLYQLKLKFYSIIIFSNIFCHTNLFALQNKKADECKSISCVRENIDQLNEEIVKLLSLRMQYVYQAGKIKLASKIETATDQKRANVVISQVEKLAKENKLPPEYVKKLFDIIVNDSTKYEQDLMNQSLKNN